MWPELTKTHAKSLENGGNGYETETICNASSLKPVKDELITKNEVKSNEQK